MRERKRREDTRKEKIEETQEMKERRRERREETWKEEMEMKK